MGRTAAAVALALSWGLLAVGCSKDPGSPATGRTSWTPRSGPARRSASWRRFARASASTSGSPRCSTPGWPRRRVPETRAVIARALGELKDPSSVDPLAAALDVNTADGATSRMNAAIAQALGDIKDPRGATALISPCSGAATTTSARTPSPRWGAAGPGRGAHPGGAGAGRQEPAGGEPARHRGPRGNRRPSRDPHPAQGDVQAAGNTVFARRRALALRDRQAVRGRADRGAGGEGQGPLQLGAGQRRGGRGGAGALRRVARRLPGHLRRAGAGASSSRTGRPPRSRRSMLGWPRRARSGKMRSAEGRKALEPMLDEPEPLAAPSTPGRWCSSAAARQSRRCSAGGWHGPWEARRTPSAPWGMLGDERDQPTMDRIAADEPKATASDCKRYGCNLPVDEVAANRLKTVKVFQAPLKAAAQCKAAMDCWVSKLGDAEGPVLQRAALAVADWQVGRAGEAARRPPGGQGARDPRSGSPGPRRGWCRGTPPPPGSWFLGAAAQLEQQVSTDSAWQDDAATSEQLRRLITEVRRRAEQA